MVQVVERSIKDGARRWARVARWRWNSEPLVALVSS